MKSTTWILITLAVAVTASMVVAKSIIFVPQKAEAQPVRLVQPIQPAKTALEPVQVQPVASAVGQHAPQFAPLPGLFEQAVRVDTPDAQPDKGNAWTVLVVNGNMEEHVTYVSPEVKSPTP